MRFSNFHVRWISGLSCYQMESCQAVRERETQTNKTYIQIEEKWSFVYGVNQNMFKLFQKMANLITNPIELCWPAQELHRVDNVLLVDSRGKYWGKTPGFVSPLQDQPKDQDLPRAVAVDNRVCSRHCPVCTSFDSTRIASLVCQ